MNVFNQHALKAALRRLLDPSRHFCVIDFDNVLKLAGITISADERLPFAALHCVSYGDMSRECKEQLVARIAELLQRQPDPLFKLQEFLSETEKSPVVELRLSWFEKLLRL